MAIQDRTHQYQLSITQLNGLLKDETDLIANLANVAAVLRENLGFFWIGFYLVKKDELILGPFQGSVACTRIKPGKGVCGTSWVENKTIVVPDVYKFPGHIVCSAESKSEIVLPINSGKGIVIGVLDIDSRKPDDFSEQDSYYLEAIVKLIESKHG